MNGNARYKQRGLLYAPPMSASLAVRRAARSTGPCHVLLEDDDLYEAVPSHHRERAVRECVADVLALPRGAWPIEDDSADAGDGVGLLILEGLVLRRMGMDGRFGAELLGRGDLLRPWQEAAQDGTLALSTSREVLTPTRVAVLDMRFANLLARYPALAEQLVARAINRSRNLGVVMAIVHQPRVDVRLRSLFWHLAGRWGQVRADGVLLPLRLTHAALADMIAARRPTVSSALAELTRRGLVEPAPEGWLLHEAPPWELAEPARCPPAELAAMPALAAAAPA